MNSSLWCLEKAKEGGSKKISGFQGFGSRERGMNQYSIGHSSGSNDEYWQIDICQDPEYNTQKKLYNIL